MTQSQKVFVTLRKMKTIILTTITATLLTSVSLPLRSANPTPADPFVAVTDQAQAAEWQNCRSVLEVYSMDKNQGRTLLESEPGSGARYRRALEMAKAGSAHLEILSGLTTKSGNKCVLEAVNEIPSPLKAQPAISKTSAPEASEIQVQLAGDILEFDVLLNADRRTSDVNIVTQRVSFLGFETIGTAPSSPATAQARFSTRRSTYSGNLPVGEPFFLGSFGSAEVEDSVRLAFLHLFVVQPTAEEQKRVVQAKQWALEYSFYAVQSALAREILLAPELGAPWAKLQAAQEHARFEQLISLSATNGPRVLAEQIQKISYAANPWGGDLGTPKPGTGTSSKPSTPAVTSSLSTRNVGTTVELEATANGVSGGGIDLIHALNRTSHLGELKAEGMPASSMPVPWFEVQKILSCQTVLPGTPNLVGTFNPSPAGPRNEEGRTWLVFVRATPNVP